MKTYSKFYPQFTNKEFNLKEKSLVKITRVKEKTETFYYLPHPNPKLITLVLQEGEAEPKIRVVEKEFIARFSDSCGLTENYKTEEHLLIENLIGEPKPR